MDGAVDPMIKSHGFESRGMWRWHTVPTYSCVTLFTQAQVFQMMQFLHTHAEAEQFDAEAAGCLVVTARVV